AMAMMGGVNPMMGMQGGMPAMGDSTAAQSQKEKEAEESDGDDYPPGPSPSINHPHYRPPDMEPVSGLTDKRFVGVMYLWFEDKGYGFIECPEITKRFGQDACWPLLLLLLLLLLLFMQCQPAGLSAASLWHTCLHWTCICESDHASDQLGA
ncbi:unnamed protein product, partial [Polarella glacialis]